MNSRSEVHHANHYTIDCIEASYKKGQIFHLKYYNVLLFCEVKIEMPVYNEWILVDSSKVSKIPKERIPMEHIPKEHIPNPKEPIPKERIPKKFQRICSTKMSYAIEWNYF